jgi:hypothetical protein
MKTSKYPKITKNNLVESLPVSFTRKRMEVLQDVGFVCSIFAKHLKKYVSFSSEDEGYFYFKIDDEDKIIKILKKDIRDKKIIELDIL